MAVRRKVVITGLVSSVFLHWFAIDGMRYGSVVRDPVSTIQVTLHNAVVNAPVRTEAPVAKGAKRAWRASSALSNEGDDRAAPAQEVNYAPVNGKDIALPVEGVLFRPMSLPESQALARIKIAQALQPDRLRLKDPVVFEIRVSTSEKIEILNAMGEAQEARRLREDLSRLFAENPALVPAGEITPLELVFLP